LAPGDPEVAVESVAPLRHETKPPARYTEASLIRKLEEKGIGRPSTYAPVIGTIQDRGYVLSKQGALLPTYIGMAVVGLLRNHFPRYVDLEFTAQMEEDLDRIARGEIAAVDFLTAFYDGDREQPGLTDRIDAELPRIEFPAVPIGHDPETGQPIIVRIGRNYVYVQIEGEDERRASLPVDLLIDELDAARAVELIAANARSREPIGQHPDTGENIYCRTGPYGPYLQLGEQTDDRKPKRVSLGRGTDPQGVDLDYALKLLSLPRELGVDPATGKAVTAGIGRYGPYVARDRVYASVNNANELFDITLEEALERIRNKRGRTPLRELGQHPKSGAPLRIFSGRYGPYVTDGKTNASLGSERDPAALTVDEAVTLLDEALARKASGTGRKRKVATKKTRKSSAKKTRKKTPRKKSKAARKKSAGSGRPGRATSRRKTTD
jgi:DNA topoisomerase-1